MPANQWVIEEIKYETLQERQVHVVIHCDGVVVMPGGIGTLAELSMAWSLVQVGEVLPRPIVTVGGLWQRTLAAFFDEAYTKLVHQKLLTIVRTPDEAVKNIVAFFAE
jgi:predicted Rossmann-fold nucleotide-binding protein